MFFKRNIIYTPKGKYRPLHTWLPDNYNQTDEQYPVMYFFDGHNLFFDHYATFGKSWGFYEFIRQWPKNMIIVGIECGHEGDERLSEYCPFQIKTGRMSKYEAMGDDTMRWITDEVKPLIDRTYQTLPERSCTGIAGSGMGGLMSIFAVSRYNHIFSKAACVSSEINFCRNQMIHEMNQNKMDPDTRVFLSWGTLEAKGVLNPDAQDTTSFTCKSNRALENRIQKAGAASMVYCQIGGRHCEEDWEKQVPIFMDFLWRS